MKQNTNTNSRRDNKANKGGNKKSLDIDFASLQNEAVDTKSDQSNSSNEVLVDGDKISSRKNASDKKVKYYSSQAEEKNNDSSELIHAKKQQTEIKPADKPEQKPVKQSAVDDNAHNIVIENPGEILQKARESLNISQADIAKWLKLDVRLIDALERGDDSVMPETVYKVGYLRSYAKLVELSPDTVIGKQASYSKTPRLVPSNENNNILEEFLAKLSQVYPSQWATSLKENDLKRGTFLAISIISFIAIAWIAASSLRTNQVTDSAQDMQKKINQKDSESPEQPLHSTSLEISSPKSDTALKKTETETKPVLSNLKISTLVLNFSADSWVDIRDATGERIIRRLGLAGMSKTVTGVAPFQVLVGYGPGVSITYNGKAYDFTGNQGKRVARFIIAPESETNN